MALTSSAASSQQYKQNTAIWSLAPVETLLQFCEAAENNFADGLQIVCLFPDAVTTP